MDHFNQATVAPPVTVYISGCSPLHRFKFVDVLFGGEVPDSRGIFKHRSDIGLVMWCGAGLCSHHLGSTSPQLQEFRSPFDIAHSLQH